MYPTPLPLATLYAKKNQDQREGLMPKILYRISGQEEYWESLQALRNFMIINKMNRLVIIRYELKEVGRSPASMLLGT